MQISNNNIVLVCRISFNKIKTQWIINLPSSMACSQEYPTSKETTSSKMETTQDWASTWAINSRLPHRRSCTPSSPPPIRMLSKELVLGARFRWPVVVRISWRSDKQPSTVSLSVRTWQNPCHLRKVKFNEEVTASNSVVIRAKDQWVNRIISELWLRGKTCHQAAPTLPSMEFHTSKVFRWLITIDLKNRTVSIHMTVSARAKHASDLAASLTWITWAIRTPCSQTSAAPSSLW